MKPSSEGFDAKKTEASRNSNSHQEKAQELLSVQIIKRSQFVSLGNPRLLRKTKERACCGR
ncbi:hypothetical protein QQ045_017013 [Rhodiola kirilowii]